MYAPRAALYEALPDLLHRLMGPTRSLLEPPGPPDSSGLPVWIRFSGGKVTYQAVSSSVGAEYDFDRRMIEGGLTLPLSKKAYIWGSVRHAIGSADVSAPTGGGEIDVTGTGPSFGFSWKGENKLYLVGAGSVTDYNIDLSSGLRGLLKAGVDADRYSLAGEVGRRFELSNTTSLTPRAWLVRSSISVKGFTDAVNSRVSYPDAHRLIGGVGTAAETVRPWGGGEFSLQGSVDIGRVLSGAETGALVSGERLVSRSPANGLLLGVDGVYHRNRFSIGGTLSVGTAFGSNTGEYSGSFRLGIHF